jgi:hypothetical protein
LVTFGFGVALYLSCSTFHLLGSLLSCHHRAKKTKRTHAAMTEGAGLSLCRSREPKIPLAC